MESREDGRGVFPTGKQLGPAFHVLWRGDESESAGKSRWSHPESIHPSDTLSVHPLWTHHLRLYESKHLGSIHPPIRLWIPPSLHWFILAQYNHLFRIRTINQSINYLLNHLVHLVYHPSGFFIKLPIHTPPLIHSFFFLNICTHICSESIQLPILLSTDLSTHPQIHLFILDTPDSLFTHLKVVHPQ